MNIIFEESITPEFKEKYMFLELDKFYFKDIEKTSTAFCALENVPIQDMIQADKFLNLHASLMENYYKRNWNYCEQAIEHLSGRWNGEVDTFYQNLLERVLAYKDNEPGPDWTGAIFRAPV
jgi:hypothetical protein